MEVINLNPDVLERKEARRRSISVPENMLNFSDDSTSCSDSRRPDQILSRSISSQGLVRMMLEDDDHHEYNKAEDEDEDEEDEEDEVKILPNKTSLFWVGGDLNEDSSYYSSSDDDYTESNGMDDLELREMLCPPQIPGFCGHCFVPVVGKGEESVDAAILKDVKLALEEYKRQKGVDYEFVKCCGVRPTSPSDPEDDSCSFGKHMNFLAKLEGLDSSPESFFASLRDDEVHCCKLSYDVDREGIQHCEHIKCLECGLWTREKV